MYATYNTMHNKAQGEMGEAVITVKGSGAGAGDLIIYLLWQIRNAMLFPFQLMHEKMNKMISRHGNGSARPNTALSSPVGSTTGTPACNW